MAAAVSGDGEAIIACAPARSCTSAVMAMLLLPSIATLSVTCVANSEMTAARSALPFSQRSTSTTAWVMTIFGLPTPSGHAPNRLIAGTPTQREDGEYALVDTWRWLPGLKASKGNAPGGAGGVRDTGREPTRRRQPAGLTATVEPRSAPRAKSAMRASAAIGITRVHTRKSPPANAPRVTSATAGRDQDTGSEVDDRPHQLPIRPVEHGDVDGRGYTGGGEEPRQHRRVDGQGAS